MLTETLQLSPEELTEYIVNQTINHGIQIDKLKREVKENALEFAKWASEKLWEWNPYLLRWDGHRKGIIATDDELYQLFLKRNG